MEKVYSKVELDSLIEKFKEALGYFYELSINDIEVDGWDSYPHENGVTIEGFTGKQWVYYQERKPHTYDWSLWKVENKIKNIDHRRPKELRLMDLHRDI